MMDSEGQRLATQRVWSEDKGQCIVAAWRRSGESPAAFARRYGIAVHRLYYRITTTDAHGPVPECGPVGFHPGRVLPERGDAGDAAPMEIRMIRVRGVAPEAICAVPAALKQYG
ncbi:hypothetical protein [Gemmatimonas sp.]|nr:hypothetical protein [Gemmatimonas sp.]